LRGLFLGDEHDVAGRDLHEVHRHELRVSSQITHEQQPAALEAPDLAVVPDAADDLADDHRTEP
jgi:hypothetical protein